MTGVGSALARCGAVAHSVMGPPGPDGSRHDSCQAAGEPVADRDLACVRAVEHLLGELIGRPAGLSTLDPGAQLLAARTTARLFSPGSEPERHALFNSLLAFCAESPVSEPFFRRFIECGAFESLEAFEAKVLEFQAVAMQLCGDFREAFQRLHASDDLVPELACLAPADVSPFTERPKFASIRRIPPARLDDLGYISSERISTERREREELATKLRELADCLRACPGEGLSNIPSTRLARVRALLSRYGSAFELEAVALEVSGPDRLEREAQSVVPVDPVLERIAETRELGHRNLAAYLGEPHMDVYVATSMRERADFISVNTFVETLFARPELHPLNLRYFDPTQTWVGDRVAKGLLEALMLRRSRLTIYMAQRNDTFGKDSEASISLGQGKPVIAYVPKLSHDAFGIDSQRIAGMDLVGLHRLSRALGLPATEGLDREAHAMRVLTAQITGLTPLETGMLVHRHWAEFDLHRELGQLPQPERSMAREFLDAIAIAPREADAPPVPPPIAVPLAQRLVHGALAFERRATMFHEVHPLALQLVAGTSMMNGLLVARSVADCARLVQGIIRNTLETRLVVDEANYRLVELTTMSTMRAVSRNQLLVDALRRRGSGT